MLKLQIETTNTIDNNFFKKGSNSESWYVRKQPVLMFKEGSKYPDKGFLTLSFTDTQIKQQASNPLSVGVYSLSDNAYYFDKNGQLSLDLSVDNFISVPNSKAA